MLFLILICDRVSVAKDKVDLVCTAALVRTKHDGVWRLIRELLELDTFGRLCQQFHICPTTLHSVLSLDFIPSEDGEARKRPG
jgi:hypothetical protein